MASLRFAVRAVVGSIGIWVPCDIIADADANADANANADADAIAVEMSLKIFCRFEVLKNS
jgi:hypothetical protein